MDVFKRLKGFYWPYKRYFFISVCFLAIVTAITVVYPIFLQVTIDHVTAEKDLKLAGYLAVSFIGIMAVKGLATFVQQYYGDVFGISAVYELRNSLYEKLQYLPFQYYDNAKTGDLMSRLTADVEGFRNFLSFGISELLRFFLIVGVCFGVMLYYSVPLTLLTLVTFPFLAVVVYQFDKKVHPAFRKVRQSFGKLNTNVQENISGINTVKSLSREAFEIDKFNRANADFKDTNLYTSSVWAKYFPLMELLGNLSVVILLAYGGRLVIGGDLTYGELVAFYSLVGYILWPVINLGFVINMFSQAKASGERLLEVLGEKQHVPLPADPIVKERLKGAVEFNQVALRYKNEGKAALSGISFKGEPGRVIGLIGATGSGKTSITQLITRFYDSSEGSILIDGEPIQSYSLETLRKNIGFVLQESFLFSSTIRSNIAYGRPDAAMEEIVEAAKRADAHQFIMELPDQYDTLLGERGMGLSGGQKQRIAIARAICLNPAILVLDDATSAVDMQTEFKIQEALKEVMRDRTTFIIAHRISSLKHADEILVLENGRITERGRHDELIRNEGQYQRIYDIQYKDQKAAEPVFGKGGAK